MKTLAQQVESELGSDWGNAVAYYSNCLNKSGFYNVDEVLLIALEKALPVYDGSVKPVTFLKRAVSFALGSLVKAGRSVKVGKGRPPKGVSIEALREDVVVESFESKVSLGDDDGDTTLLEQTADAAAELPYDATIRAEDKLEQAESVKRALAALNEQQRLVVELRVIGGKGLAEVAEVLGLSLQRVSQIEKKAIEVMKETVN